MFPFKYPVPQTDPPRSPRETLPTMYDLPSEDPEEPGLPDEFHDLQPQLLSITFRPRNYPVDRVYSASDMNLYYDVRHPQWYKRPDWFGVVGVPRLYDGVDIRMSYVVWQEGINPFVVVELLSPGTEKEDLGQSDDEMSSESEIEGNGQAVLSQIAETEDLAENDDEMLSESEIEGDGQTFLSESEDDEMLSESEIEENGQAVSSESEEEEKQPSESKNLEGNGRVAPSKSGNKPKPPRKWEVYEKILRIPYYVVFSRYTDELRVFKQDGGQYQEIQLQEPRIWIPDLKLGLGLWQGEYQGIERSWLRWYDAKGNWIPTEAEQLEQERTQKLQALERAKRERRRAERERQRAKQQQQRAEEERQRAEEERQRAEEERQRAEQSQAQLDSLIQRLRESGIDPDTFLNG